MPYLVRKKFDGSAADRWELPDKALTFGRGEDADVLIKDERMSRQHFSIAPRDGKYYVRDLNSTNGTYVNNERITEKELQPNDKIRGGQTVMVFEVEQPKTAATVIG